MEMSAERSARADRETESRGAGQVRHWCSRGPCSLRPWLLPASWSFEFFHLDMLSWRLGGRVLAPEPARPTLRARCPRGREWDCHERLCAAGRSLSVADCGALTEWALGQGPGHLLFCALVWSGAGAVQGCSWTGSLCRKQNRFPHLHPHHPSGWPDLGSGALGRAGGTRFWGWLPAILAEHREPSWDT